MVSDEEDVQMDVFTLVSLQATVREYTVDL